MKIGLCGTMSVGKTTLVNALKETEQFNNYNFATERSKYLSNLGIPLNTDSTLKGQTVFLAERCAELMQDNIITDRTVFDVIDTLHKRVRWNVSTSYERRNGSYICDPILTIKRNEFPRLRLPEKLAQDTSNRISEHKLRNTRELNPQ